MIVRLLRIIFHSSTSLRYRSAGFCPVERASQMSCYSDLWHYPSPCGGTAVRASHIERPATTRTLSLRPHIIHSLVHETGRLSLFDKSWIHFWRSTLLHAHHLVAKVSFLFFSLIVDDVGFSHYGNDDRTVQNWLHCQKGLRCAHGGSLPTIFGLTLATLNFVEAGFMFVPKLGL